ncbi:MAG: hybrid sensor histidine kinase/response regulator [Deltaproteobacteria bacterium]|nr:MAG: hybrid sensor histidine kinase/response regulator [Deltaproteobacteria bacterium]
MDPIQRIKTSEVSEISEVLMWRSEQSTFMHNSILLAVDDKPDNLFILEQLIAGYCPDCKVITAQSAANGLALVAETPPDVAVVDVQMPDMDGIEMCRHLKTDRTTANVPVILLTAHRTTPQLKVKGLEAGADDFITKPVDNIELIAKIRVMLRIKKAEDALRQERDKSEERYRLLFNKMIHGFALHDIICDESGKPCDYRFTEVNPAFETITGLSALDVVGKRILEVLPDTEPFWIETYGEVALTGNSARFEKYSQELDKYFDVIAYRPHPGQFATVFADVTEQKHLEAQLRQAQKMEAIGTLAGGIAHDFNNILFPIFGYTEMAMQDVPEDSRARKNLAQVLRAANRAKNLVQHILTFSRKSDKEIKPLMVQPIIREVLKLLRATLPTTIRISQNIDKTCGPVMADPVQIHQIIMNLCTNAYHAMDEGGGTLNVTLNEMELGSDPLSSYSDMEPGPYLKFTVSDTGHGMTDEVMERIFDPYFTTKEQNKGTGLGLSVVHGIIKSYGGHISVYSKPGQGAAFHICLPLIEAKPAEQERLSDDPIPRGQEHILLLDDEEQIVQMEAYMLERLGYKITRMTASPEALKAFRAAPENFDLVITDMTMPSMTGLELSREVIRIRPDMPIILLSGFSDLITEESVKAAGIREYAEKPVTRGSLAKMIRRVLDNEKKKIESEK